MPLVTPTERTYFSPWRNEYRTAQGVLHALYVFRVIDGVSRRGILRRPVACAIAASRSRTSCDDCPPDEGNTRFSCVCRLDGGGGRLRRLPSRLNTSLLQRMAINVVDYRRAEFGFRPLGGLDEFPRLFCLRLKLGDARILFRQL